MTLPYENATSGRRAVEDIRRKPHPVTGSKVVLTVAHLDHRPKNCSRENLRAWCQRCHNTYDAPMRRAGVRKRRDEAVGQKSLELEANAS